MSVIGYHQHLAKHLAGELHAKPNQTLEKEVSGFTGFVDSLVIEGGVK